MKLSDQITRRHLFVAFGTSSQSGSLSSVDLAATRDDASVSLSASDGSVAPLLAADALTAGVMTAADKARLDGIPPIRTRDLAAAADVPGATVGDAITHLRTAGYTSVGDRGGALYARVGAEPGHPFKVQSADGTWWEGVPGRGGVSPRQLGAAGDGVADDTAALTDAAGIDAPLVIPKGTFRVTGTVPLVANKAVRGQGGIIFADPATTYSGAFEVAGNGVEIVGVRFRGNGVSTGVANHAAAPGGAAIKGDLVEGTRIVGCTFEDFVITGADIQAGSLALTDCRGVIVSGNYWLPSNSGGIDVSLPYRCGDCQIIGNYSRSGADVFAYVSTVGGEEKISIDSELHKTSHHVISGNVHIKWDGKGANTGGRHGILLHYNGGYSHSTITSNILVGGTRHGLYIRGDNTVGGPSGPDVVTGNIIRYFGGGQDSGTTYWTQNCGILIESSLPSVVANNLVEKSGYYPDGTARPFKAAGISLARSVRDMQLTGNRVWECRGVGIMIAPTAAPTVGEFSVERLEIVGNNVRDTEDAGIVVTDRNPGTYQWVNIRGNVVLIGAAALLGIGVSADGTGRMHVEGNTVIGTGATGGQTGVGWRSFDKAGDALRITGNLLESLDRGIASRDISASGVDGGDAFHGGRGIGEHVIVSENDFVDCGDALRVPNSAKGQLNLISPSNRFLGTTPKPDRSMNNWNRVVLGEAIGQDANGNTLFEVHVTDAAPAFEAWLKGDRIKQLDPAAAGKMGAVCVTAGTPGTWKGYGAIDA